jgi:hypothetical protein
MRYRKNETNKLHQQYLRTYLLNKYDMAWIIQPIAWKFKCMPIRRGGMRVNFALI